MPLKSKVKFTEKENQGARKDVTTTSPPPSDNGNQTAPTMNKRKSKRIKTQEQIETFEEESYEDIGQDAEGRQVASAKTLALTLSDPDKNVSDGSISDVEVPPVKWPPVDDSASTPAICSLGVENSESNNMTCSDGLYLSVSQKISPCIKSDGQDFATTDYNTSATLSFIPTLLHPINGQVSTFIRHREFTDYLRNSGLLRMFGTCILSVYRMKTWPQPESLTEQILNAMGYQIPSRKQVEELNKLKQALTAKLKLLTKERCQLLEKLEEYQDSAARYELLDQDEILPPRPENSPLNMELMSETFSNIQFGPAARDEEASTELKVIVQKPAPVSDTLAIPLHDKRMLF